MIFAPLDGEVRASSLLLGGAPCSKGLRLLPIVPVPLHQPLLREVVEARSMARTLVCTGHMGCGRSLACV